MVAEPRSPERAGPDPQEVRPLLPKPSLPALRVLGDPGSGPQISQPAASISALCPQVAARCCPSGNLGPTPGIAPASRPRHYLDPRALPARTPPSPPSRSQARPSPVPAPPPPPPSRTGLNRAAGRVSAASRS